MLYTLCYHLSRLIPIKALRRRLKGIFLYKKEQPKALEYLNQNYISPFLKGELKHYEFKPLKEFKDSKIIWQFWAQGKENAPRLVQTCLASIQAQMKDYEIIVLDESTVQDYINFPPLILQKLENGTLSKTFFSDLLRVCLLASYGGVWLDATIFLSAKIPQSLLEKDFFAFQRSKEPPQDYKLWQGFDYRYFIWDEGFKIRLLSSFIIAKPRHKLLLALQDMMISFWLKEDKLPHYFTFQLLFELLVSNEAYASFNCEITNDTDAHLLQLHAKEPFDEALWAEIQQKSPVHKLTYFKNLPENSMVSRILKLKKEDLEGFSKKNLSKNEKKPQGLAFKNSQASSLTHKNSKDINSQSTHSAQKNSQDINSTSIENSKEKIQKTSQGQKDER